MVPLALCRINIGEDGDCRVHQELRGICGPVPEWDLYMAENTERTSKIIGITRQVKTLYMLSHAEQHLFPLVIVEYKKRYG